MITRIIASVALVLALGAGAAYAASQLASSSGTQLCVNDVNGLVRVDANCRVGEHPISIGGGGNVQVTQDGPSTVAWGATGAGKTLPLTGVTVAGKCEVYPSPAPAPEYGLARLLITTSGSMAAFAGNLGTIGGQTLLMAPAAASGTGVTHGAGGPAIVIAGDATATITVGAQVDATAGTCTFVWQAVEAPN